MKILFIIPFLLLTNPAFAYLDPGTGSIIIQAFLASLAAASSFLWVFWARIKAFFVRTKPDEDKDDNSEQS